MLSTVSEVISGDLNGDNFHDLIIAASSSEGIITVYPNVQGDYTDVQPVIIIDDGAENLQGVSIMDVDNDGLMDIIGCNRFGDKIRWFKNLGDFHFSAITTLVTGIDGPFLTTISDIDNDGFKDLVVVVSSNDSVIWLKNNGNGTFMNGQTIFISASYDIAKIVAKDLNNDGLPEIIIGDANSTVYWQKNLGNGLFSTKVQLGNSSSGKSFVFEDINNDTYPDYVSSNGAGLIRQLNQLGNTFAASQSTFIGVCNEIKFKDIDYDGITDLVGSVGSGISYSKRLANGTFTTLVSLISVTPASIFIVDDVNNDSFNDFIVPSYGTTTTSLKKTSAYMGTSVITLYNKKDICFYNSSPTSVKIADLDHDGKNDIITMCGGIVWNKNKGGGAFTSYKPISEYFNGSLTSNIKIADMDNDNDLDVISITAVSGIGVKIYYNDGFGKFTLGYTAPITCCDSSSNIEIADLNGDSLKDIVMYFGGGSFGNVTIAWIPALTTTTYGGLTTIATNGGSLQQVSILKCVDIDSDNDIDFISYSKGSSTARFHKHLNNGSGSFTDTAFGSISDVYSFVYDDYDNDGDKDIIASTSGSYMKMLKNNNGVFASPSAVHLNQSYAFELVDINYDGLKDIIETLSASNSGIMRYYLNNGLGGFGNAVVISSSSQVQSSNMMAMGDLNNDCKSDIVYGLYSPSGVGYILNTSISPSSVVNLKLFIQGYFDAGAMRSVKFNQDGISPTTDVEDITVKLLNAAEPYAVIDTTTALLKTDGTAVCTFSTAPVGSFYIVVSTQSAIKTWSATPVLVGPTALFYDFSTGVDKAYGNNMVQLEPGVFGFYSGDFNQDGVIDNKDAPNLYNDIDASAFGILSTDLNGDGTVDNADAPIYYNNSEGSIYSHDPYYP